MAAYNQIQMVLED